MSIDPRKIPTTGHDTGPTNPYHEPIGRQGASLDEHTLNEIRALPKRFLPGSRSAVMPALDLVQEELGYLTPAAMTQVAEALQLDPGYVEGVATFYTLFHLQPVGKHHFYVCNNLSCQLAGADEILEHLKHAIGVREYGEVTGDGFFSCEPVECLGACEYAPVMRHGHRLHYDLTPLKLDELLAGIRPNSFLDRRETAERPRTARKEPRKPHA
ncbi:MAG TPA: NAD(P)H-dependent oxidoreductase subunit E [Candidatus Dormibacteraeota bacterium]